MKKRETIADAVVAAFGGTERGSLTNAAALLGLSISTVDSWKRSGKIPTWRYHEISEAARRHNVKLPESVTNAIKQVA